VAEGDAYGQARFAMRKALAAAEALGGSLEGVVRTRLFVVDIARDADAVGRAHAEVFGSVRPASTLVQVSALVDPALLVEVEVEAVVGVDRG
jgi:enamine deaminase RidA (YjgF/YER057c/UK114 family)